MPESITIRYDNEAVLVVPVERDAKRRFHEGRCWSARCSNTYEYIHLNKNGVATHAYCAGDHNCAIYAMAYHREIERGKWIAMSHDKIPRVVWIPPEIRPRRLDIICPSCNKGKLQVPRKNIDKVYFDYQCYKCGAKFSNKEARIIAEAQKR